MPSDITIDPNPSEADIAAITRRLELFNSQKTNRYDAEPLHLAVRDEEGRLIGGLNGITSFGWLYIEILWLDEPYRHDGIGSDLLQLAEAEALSRGCQHACLMTFSFQARPFYEKHGYTVFGQLEDYPEGETLFYLRKRLGS